jgi:hypothetical protein
MNGPAGCVRLVATLLALALVLVIVLTLPLTVLAHDIGRIVFSPSELADLVVGRIVDSGWLKGIIRDRLLSGELLPAEPGGGFNMGEALRYLEPAEVESILDILLPPEWARDQVSGILESLSAWLEDAQPTPALSLDLQPLKDRLLSGGAAELAEAIVDSWPACATELVSQMIEAGVSGSDTPWFFCEPPEPLRSLLIAGATQTLVEQARALPSRLALGSAGTSQAIPGMGLEQILVFKERIRLARVLSGWGWILSLSLLGLIMALVVRSWRNLAKWWGTPLFVGGLLTLLVLITFRALANRYLLPALALSTMPAVLSSMLTGVMEGLVAAVVRRLLLHGLVITLAGALLLLLLLVSRGKAAPPMPTAADGGGPSSDAGAEVPPQAA